MLGNFVYSSRAKTVMSESDYLKELKNALIEKLFPYGIDNSDSYTINAATVLKTINDVVDSFELGFLSNYKISNEDIKALIGSLDTSAIDDIIAEFMPNAVNNLVDKINAEIDVAEPKTKVIKNWYDLDGLENDNYRIEVDHNMLCGWVVDKTEGHHKCYLSTHTFYEMNYKGSTKILNDLGFDVVLESWG